MVERWVYGRREYARASLPVWGVRSGAWAAHQLGELGGHQEVPRRHGPSVLRLSIQELFHPPQLHVVLEAHLHGRWQEGRAENRYKHPRAHGKVNEGRSYIHTQINPGLSAASGTRAAATVPAPRPPSPAPCSHRAAGRCRGDRRRAECWTCGSSTRHCSTWADEEMQTSSAHAERAPANEETLLEVSPSACEASPPSCKATPETSSRRECVCVHAKPSEGLFCLHQTPRPRVVRRGAAGTV
jgi:hypothetical protein